MNSILKSALLFALTSIVYFVFSVISVTETLLAIYDFYLAVWTKPAYKISILAFIIAYPGILFFLLLMYFLVFKKLSPDSIEELVDNRDALQFSWAVEIVYYRGKLYLALGTLLMTILSYTKIWGYLNVIFLYRKEIVRDEQLKIYCAATRGTLNFLIPIHLCFQTLPFLLIISLRDEGTPVSFPQVTYASAGFPILYLLYLAIYKKATKTERTESEWSNRTSEVLGDLEFKERSASVQSAQSTVDN